MTQAADGATPETNIKCKVRMVATGACLGTIGCMLGLILIVMHSSGFAIVYSVLMIICSIVFWWRYAALRRIRRSQDLEEQCPTLRR